MMKTLFKNGTIYDGTGNKPYIGDVLIEDERIVAVGGTITEAADKVVDLTGYQICPGLIDAHSHNDFFYDREDAEKFYRPFIEQASPPRSPATAASPPLGSIPIRPTGTRSAAGSLTRLPRAASPNSKNGRRVGFM